MLTDPEIILSTSSMGFFAFALKQNLNNFLYTLLQLFTCVFAIKFCFQFCILFQNSNKNEKYHTLVLLPEIFS
jgi:hypothetical protein